MAINKTLARLREETADSEARNALLELFDENSFTELLPFTGSSVVAGRGFVGGVLTYAFAQDMAVSSGAVSKAAAAKISRLYKEAVKNGAPVVSFYSSKGGDISEGAELMSAYGEILNSIALLSGVSPQISVIDGVCGGTASVAAAMSDFVIMTEKSELFLIPPFISNDKTEGAGSAKNAAMSGVSCLNVKDLDEALKAVKKLIALLPQNNLEVGISDYFEPSEEKTDASLGGEAMIKALADKDSLIELFSDFGKTAYIALGSINQKTTGFVATDKADGRLTLNDSAKIARFVGICDSFSIPIITVINSEGYDLSAKAEALGSVRNAAKLTQAYASATTPKIALITKNALGGIFSAFCGANADFTIALEPAVIAPITPKAAAVFLYADSCQTKEELEKAASEYAECEASALNALKKGVIDTVIEPEEITKTVNDALEALSGKRASSPPRKHINFVY